jgi:branched-chain amino acid transport system substrate-binding protein
MKNISRRDFLKLSAVTAAGLALGGCIPQMATGRAIKIGYVSPQTGPLSGFGEPDNFILKSVRDVFAQGLTVGKATHPLEIILADSESNSNRAAAVAIDLIKKDKIDLMLVANTPETTIPVCDQCEANGIPCVSTNTPWQPWYFRVPDVPASGYKWTYHFFWGLEDVIATFLNIWESLGTNKVVGGLWPNDGDGLSWSDPELGFPPSLIARGFKVIDPGRYENLNGDFSSQIAKFIDAGVEIVTGVMLPPDLPTFLAQADQQGFKPKAVTVAKAALFPSSVEAMGGNLGDGLTTEIWWSPNHPFKSSLTGASAGDLANAYQQETGKQWTQPIGCTYALFEVAADILTRAENIEDKAKIVAAIKATQLNTIFGPVAWGSGPTPNVAKTPLVGGQWGRGKDFPWDLSITSNINYKDIPTNGRTRLMPGS